ncbi:amino acid ABC transporter permease [Anaeromassilibacillus senegalensis]|uniref:amino acid ABC transporter permease n=1 Tax=Anaeromassilibacillus senegalensis TaxID=1673717 RepID=UPI0006813E7F|nr:amino acid ABC transporter permease [Anaeromassilibacillus senegalensis]
MNTLFASVPLSFFSDLGQQFYDDFILKDRYQYIIRGLGNTVLLTLVAVVIGVVLGTVVALVRITHQNNPKKLRVLNGICGLYLTVIRGTPVVVQLMIMVYLILSSGETLLVAMLAFGINSGAYVAEVIRSGIQSVDRGQIEAGRSLGLSNRTTMIKIVFPQALKNVAPAIFNEFIALLKETSIAGYVGVQDLTKGGDIIRSITYDAFLPLFLIAGIYLVLVILLTSCLSGLERRLRKSDKR